MTVSTAGPGRLEVGFDAGVPVEGVDDDAVVVAVDRGAEDALGGAADLPVEMISMLSGRPMSRCPPPGLEERPAWRGR